MPYRADDVALNTRRELLEERLKEIRARARELADVRAEEQKTIAELDAVRRRIGPTKSRLPMLQSVKVASPCSASWDEMSGGEQVRFCGKCEKNVYNLSAMSAEAAEALLVQKEGKACVRFFQRPDGTVMTADCPVGVRRKRVRRLAAAAVGGGVLAAAASTLFARPGCPMAQGEVAVQVQGKPMPIHFVGAANPDPAPARVGERAPETSAEGTSSGASQTNHGTPGRPANAPRGTAR